jgi:hypothetical protein
VSIPGFAAESSLGPALGIYIGKSVHRSSSRGVAADVASISPQQLAEFGAAPGSDCFGSLRQCIADHCFGNDLNPMQAALCRRACSQPAVCGPCRCSGGVCERECRKSFVSSSGGFADLFCRGAC